MTEALKKYFNYKDIVVISLLVLFFMAVNHLEVNKETKEKECKYNRFDLELFADVVSGTIFDGLPDDSTIFFREDSPCRCSGISNLYRGKQPAIARQIG